MKHGARGQRAALVAICALLLLRVTGVIDFSLLRLWPLALLGGALACERRGRADPDALLPGGVLTVYGALLLACSLGGWGLMGRLWPCFLLGPALGLYRRRRARGRHGAGAGGVLAGLAAACWVMMALPGGALVPLIMICAGGALLLSVIRRRR